MKLEQAEREILSNVSGKTVDFKISGNAMIFDILRNKIYQDPIGSICREICDNARDAHRAAKVTRPFDIIVGEYLVIRDYGVGMSPDLIEHIYASYGSSNKRDTNELSGGFGLGCKTPFAYSDTFIVITHWDGVEYEYCMFIDESNCGKITLMSEKPSTEVGTTVKIPIHYGDRQRFLNNILKFTQYYGVSGDPLPNILGETRPEPKFTDYGMAVSYFGPHGTHVLVNGIPYAINNHYYTAPIWGKFILKFGVGELELAASRETIQNTDKNMGLIKKKIAELSAIFFKDVQTGKGDFKAYLDRITTYQDIFNGEDTEFDFEGNKFQYPLRDSVGHCYKDYSGKNRWCQVHNLNKLDKAEVIILKDELTSYKKAKISQYIKNMGKQYAYVFDYDFFLEGTKFEDIKLPRVSSGGGNYTGNIRLWDGSYYKSVDIQDVEFLYTTEDSKWRFYQMWNHQFELPVYRIAPGNVKKVVAAGNQSFDDYFDDLLSQHTLEEFKQWSFYRKHGQEVLDIKWLTEFAEIEYDFNFKKTYAKLDKFNGLESVILSYIHSKEPAYEVPDFKIDVPYFDLISNGDSQVRQLYKEYVALKERVSELTKELEGEFNASALYAG